MDPSCQARLRAIAEKFKICRGALSALGDETRQLIILALLESDQAGVRVGELTQKVHLSRPSVSHHLQILREAKIVNMRREGTRNYYYIDAHESQWETLHALLALVCEGLRESAAPSPQRDEETSRAGRRCSGRRTPPSDEGGGTAKAVTEGERLDRPRCG